MGAASERLRFLAARRRVRAAASALVAVGLLLPFVAPIPASASPLGLSITPLTWDVVGLDSNSPATGPSVFPVGVRVCNQEATTLTGVGTAFTWTSSNADIALSGSSAHTLADLAPSSCADDYYNIVVTQASASFGTVRGYSISASATGAVTVSTPSPRQIYVQSLVSQDRNGITSITGPSTVTDGNTYTYTLSAFTATNGYGELQTFLTFPTDIFAVRSIAVSYAVGGTNDRPWADACGWDTNPTSGTYGSCIGPTAFASGNVGGNPITMTYTVAVVGTGAATLAAVIMDHSGSSFHYNADFGTTVKSVTAQPAPPPAPAAQVGPNPADFGSQTAGTTSAPLTVTVTNTGTAPLVFGANSATLSGTTAADYALTADTCSSSSVAPGATCTVTLTFSPSTTGARPATLSFADNAADTPQSAALAGTGTSTPTPGPSPSPAPAPPAPGDRTSRGVGITPQSAAIDVPPGDTLTLRSGGSAVSSVNMPGQGTYVLAGLTWTITFTPALGFIGTASPVTFRITDVLGQSGEATYTPTVDPPAAPTPAPRDTTGLPSDPQSTTVGVPGGGSITLLGDGSPVTAVTVEGEGTYSLDPTTGTITFTPVDGFVGTASLVVYQVTDAYGQKATSTYTAAVLGLTIVRSAPAAPSPAATALPFTGADIVPLLALAFGLMAAGALLLGAEAGLAAWRDRAQARR